VSISSFFAKFHVLCLIVGAPVVSLAPVSSLFAKQEQQQEQQQQGQQQQQETQQDTSQPDSINLPALVGDPSARPKPKKVWTNDEVISLRTPADIYLQEKETQQAADAEAAAKKAALAKEMKDAGITLDLPPTADATQQLIQVREDQLKDFQQRVDALHHDLSNTPPEKKEVMQRQLEDFTRQVRKIELELKILRQHLEELNKAKAAELPSQPSIQPAEPKPE
jgi:hypothetical protein